MPLRTRLSLGYTRISNSLRAAFASKQHIKGVRFVDLRGKKIRTFVEATTTIAKAIELVDVAGQGEFLRQHLRTVIACDGTGMEGFLNPLTRTLWLGLWYRDVAVPEEVIALSMVSSAAKFEAIHEYLAAGGPVPDTEALKLVSHAAAMKVAAHLDNPEGWREWLTRPLSE